MFDITVEQAAIVKRSKTVRIIKTLWKHQLRQCDRNNQLAYLESSNPKNIPLYERHGFELLGIIQEGTSPPIFPMLRYPKPVTVP